MDKGLIFTTVGNHLEEFVHSLKYMHNIIRVKFFLKMRPYGCKLIIDATDKIADKTFFNCLIKIRSLQEIEALKLILEGMHKSIDKFCEAQYSNTDSSDAN